MIFAIDPGTRVSGWALVCEDRTIVETGLVKTPKGLKGIEAADAQMEELAPKIEKSLAQILVVEMFSPRAPMRGMAGNMYLIGMLWETAKAFGLPPMVKVYPSAWKKMFPNNDFVANFYDWHEDELSQHEIDALGIAAYYLEKV